MGKGWKHFVVIDRKSLVGPEKIIGRNMDIKVDSGEHSERGEQWRKIFHLRGSLHIYIPIAISILISIALPMYLYVCIIYILYI